MNGNVWKILGGIAVIFSLVASIFVAGMNFQSNADNKVAIDRLDQKVDAQYMREDIANLRFLAIQEQLARIERSVMAAAK